MNIVAQSCGVILLLILIYFYCKHRRLNLHTEKAFLRLLFISLITLAMDIASIIGIIYAEVLPSWVWQVLCKGYLISLNWTIYAGNMYVCMDLHKAEKLYKRLVNGIRGAFLLGTVFIAALPIAYQYKDKNEIYTEGPSVIATYALAVVLISAIVYQLRQYKNMVNQRRKHAITVWVCLWLVAATIQFFNNQLLIVGFAIALANMIMYLVLENPEANIDRDSGLFNQNGLRLYMRQMYENGTAFSMMTVTFRYAESSETKAEITPKDKKEILSFFLSMQDVYIFTTIENEVILIFKDKEALESGIQTIQERFDGCLCGVRSEETCRRLELRYVIAEDSSVAETEDMLLSYFQYCRHDVSRQLQGNFVYIDAECVQDIETEKRITRMLERAISENRVEVFYQPIYSTKEKCFTSAEALARIRDEEGKIIPPGLFIQVAEKTGMIVRLGERIFEKVCAFIESEEYKRLGISYIEVNLSMIQCGYEFLARDYIQIMEQYHVLPKHINLEITESASMQAKQILLENMRQLREYGVTFSLDDFGTGQSNLNYIAEMPVDIVKFDKDMTQAYFKDEKVRYVVKTAMDMIQGMGMKIVSEGIEEKRQFETMEELQIDYIQGYYFSKPLPQAEFCKFMKSA